MPLMEAGKNDPRLDFTPASQLMAEAWGELWRGEHGRLGKVIVAVYGGPQGPGLFSESRAGLERLKGLGAQGACAGVAKVLEIHPDFGPHAVIFEDPGGESLVQADEQRRLEDITSHARIFMTVATTVAEAKFHNVTPLGINPRALIECPAATEHPWRIVPVAAGAVKASASFGGGLYTAPELSSTPSVQELNADTYALTWAWIELAAGQFGMPRDKSILKKYVPYRRLATMLTNGISPMGGVYADPRVFATGADRWMKREAKEDIAEIEEAQAKAGRPPWKQFLYENRQILKKVGILVGALLGVLLLCLGVKAALSVRATSDTPRGLLELYAESMVQGKVNTAKGLCVEGATVQTPQIHAEFARLQGAGKCGPLSAATTELRGDGDSRTGKIHFYDDDGVEILYTEMNIKKTNDGPWRVSLAMHKVLVEPEEEQPAE